MNCLSLVEHIIENCTELILTNLRYREDEGGSMMNSMKRWTKYLHYSIRGSYGAQKTSIISTTPFFRNWTWRTTGKYILNITT